MSRNIMLTEKTEPGSDSGNLAGQKGKWVNVSQDIFWFGSLVELPI